MTIREVAARAGVSVSTVSRVLNGRDAHHMRPETKERVLRAIEELEYTPVKAARALRRQRTQVIGILVPDISNPFFSLLARGAERAAFKAGYSILICDSNNSRDKEDIYLQTLLAESVEGIVLVPVGEPDKKIIEKLLRRGIDVIAADRRVPGLPVVEADNRKGMRELTRWILCLGYKKIAYIAGPSDVSTARARLEGFRETMKEAGVEPVTVSHGNFTYEAGYHLTREILRSKSQVDVVMCGNDLMAIGAIRAAVEHGLRVPRDIGISGFDGIPWFKFLYPTLATVEVPIMQIGAEAVRNIIRRGPPINVTLPVKLVQGQSVLSQGAE